jgi:hypothetical protein
MPGQSPFQRNDILAALARLYSARLELQQLRNLEHSVRKVISVRLHPLLTAAGSWGLLALLTGSVALMSWLGLPRLDIPGGYYYHVFALTAPVSAFLLTIALVAYTRRQRVYMLGGRLHDELQGLAMLDIQINQTIKSLENHLSPDDSDEGISY